MVKAILQNQIDRHQGDRGRVCAAGGTGRGGGPEHRAEWVRDILMGRLDEQAAKAPEETVLAELLGLRAILLNLLFKVAKGERMTGEADAGGD